MCSEAIDLQEGVGPKISLSAGMSPALKLPSEQMTVQSPYGEPCLFLVTLCAQLMRTSKHSDALFCFWRLPCPAFSPSALPPGRLWHPASPACRILVAFVSFPWFHRASNFCCLFLPQNPQKANRNRQSKLQSNVLQRGFCSESLQFRLSHSRWDDGCVCL